VIWRKGLLKTLRAEYWSRNGQGVAMGDFFNSSSVWLRFWGLEGGWRLRRVPVQVATRSWPWKHSEQPRSKLEPGLDESSLGNPEHIEGSVGVGG
jgi:hypothetical protein